MKLNKLLYVALFTILLVSTLNLPIKAKAATLGTLSYWFSDGYSIGRWKVSPKTYVNAPNGGSLSEASFNNYVSDAKNAWSSTLGLSFSTASSNSLADINYYAGSLSYLRTIIPSLPLDKVGATKYNLSTEGTWTFSGATVDGYVVNHAIVCIRGDVASPNYTNTSLHETGHALGWIDHSKSSSDIMYTNVNSTTSLTSSDKNQLIQVYK